MTKSTILHHKKNSSEINSSFLEIIDQLEDGYFETDLSGNFTFVNAAIIRMFGYSQEELLSMNNREYMAPQVAKEVYEIYNRVYKTGNAEKGIEYEVIKKDGETAIVDVTLSLIKNEANETFGFRGVIRDVTSQKLMEQELILYQNQLEEMVEQRTLELTEAKKAAEQANQAKTEFLANISHELRTPLHGILSFSRFGLDKIEVSDKSNNFHYFKRINEAGHRLMFLVDDLLDIAMLESGRIQYYFSQNDLVTIADFAVQRYEQKLKEKDIQVKILKPEISTLVDCDSNKITQMIQNLLSNAIRYSHQTSVITISFEKSENLGEQKEKPALTFSIQDQGVGIPEAERQLIFEKFKQSSRTDTGAGGTGLGLSICQEIIKGHHGIIWAENNPTQGARFRFTIPYKSDPGN